MSSKFTVIVPSYQGGEYLKQCVRSVLAQTYSDFDLAVLENCSEDGSAEWLASLGDSRIKVYPSSKPLSIEDNWARALEIPKNEFITFFGHDDLMDENYLEIMDALIRQHPDAGLYHAHFRFIDEEGKTIKPCRPLPPHQTGAQFLEAFLTWQVGVNGTGYMMRAQAYEAVGGIPHFQNLLYADHVLWLRLIGKSHKATAPQECFSYRLHTTSTSASSNWRAYLKAIPQFAEFFLDFDKGDAEVAHIFQKHGADFFSKLYSERYMDVLTRCTKKNERFDPQLQEAVFTGLARISPQHSQMLRKMKRVRLHRAINSNQLTRRLYQIYNRVRYSE